MSTPLMKQYNEIKSQHPDSILFFRLGDFYEMFYDDAKIASRVLGLVLTARTKEGGGVPMAGFPFHAAGSYISKLISNGYKVAVCEQSDDISGKIVRRSVTKVVTPGTFSDPDYLEAKSNNYIASFCAGLNGCAIAWMDLTTGDFRTTEFRDYKPGVEALFKLSPKEILLGTIRDKRLEKDIKDYAELRRINISYYQFEKAPERFLEDFFELNNLSSIGLAEKKYSTFASASLLKYVSDLQNSNSIKRLKYESEEFLLMDFSSQENLNLFGSNSLFSVIDKTKSAMGGRFLKRSLGAPLRDIGKILQRQDDVTRFIDNPLMRSEVSMRLSEILDFERSFNRVLRREANIRDLNVIKKSLKASSSLYDPHFFEVRREDMDRLHSFLSDAILDSNALSIKEGGIINPEYDKELKELNRISSEGKNFLLEMEAREREATGIRTLKIGYNKVFGYYIEVTNTNLAFVPESYIRKQTLSNAERYITEELKNYEEKVLTAKEKMCEIEYRIFNELLDKLSLEYEFFKALAENISYLDFIVSLSEVAIGRGYCKPAIKESGELVLRDSRHPIVETITEGFISNDLNLHEGEIMILTGPNMSGKSTFMRQTALIVLLAHIGSFVPASYAEIPLTDRIFTRVGASDDLFSGQSTFMVEMNEVANIVSNATSSSLIILDEVGRGTSTYDGISIARAVTEHIHDNIRAKTIFATHYHELNELEAMERVSNYRFEVEEKIDRVVFLKKIVRGNADKSYGIEVARLAGLPSSVLNRAKALLNELVGKTHEALEESLEKEIIRQIKEIDLNHTAPLELYKILQQIKDKLE